MARKVKDVTVSEEGRDKGKVFVLTEMPASRAEKIGQRMAVALMRAASGDNAANEALMDEVMTCVQFRPDPLTHPQTVRPLIEDDIEEVATGIKRRQEVAELHVGFFAVDALSRLISATGQPGSSDTPTSPGT